MRKIIVFNLITLDGFVAGPNGEIDWHRVDAEFNDFAIDQLNAGGGLIFGRVTYELMASYWPTPAALQDDPVVASKMNSISKIVVSHSLTAASWNNTRLIKGQVVDELNRIIQEPGGDLYVFGSANLTATLIQHGLIDEYRFIVVPVVLGRGLPMFRDVSQSFSLSLVRTRTFGNGNILLVYHPIQK